VAIAEGYRGMPSSTIAISPGMPPACTSSQNIFAHDPHRAARDDVKGIFGIELFEQGSLPVGL
jgi:hypothetical protein